MQIGTIKKTNFESQEKLEGQINTLKMNLKFELRENENRQSMNAPNFSIVGTAKHGEVLIGNAWIKTINKIGEAPKEFFSMTFDDPSFEHPLNVAAFPNGDDEWQITWRRRQNSENTEN